MRNEEKSNNQDPSNPEVSWLICSNQLNEHLFDSLDSCLNQTFQNFEIVFIANGINCREIADAVSSRYQQDSRLKIYQSDVSHLIFSLNLGINYARASLIARMDADDVCPLDRLQCQIDFMRENPEVGVLGLKYQRIDMKGNLLEIVDLPTSDKQIRQSLTWRNPICHPSVMYRRKMVSELGGYMGGVHAEDYDLWLRIATRTSYKFATLNYPLLKYRVEGGSQARRSRFAYASVAGSQFQQFVLSSNPKWLLAALQSGLKIGISWFRRRVTSLT